ncbi:alpha/beta hydrolase [Streptomyces sp. PKU-EA00015]|uniref:alpha/beta fold hydrolase n=1 Tax=Streptomyces sp. PKU-EA00015 TaxID=2748326 RepID=UPI0015A218EB|nr:alpha/beta hydrolase [Streptomyces sp. PKU-EA00015]NWF30246.1 alpha/beta hydrolase [Streptomyces sp. PKU-EA00015]
MSDSEVQGPYDLSYREDTPRIRTREGVELYYESSGEGPAITLLNNFFITAPFWRAHTEALVENHRVVSYDLANHGKSSRLDREPTWEEHAADVIGLLDGLEIESTYLVATSASSQLARDVALAHPDRVKGMVMAGPVFGLRNMRRHRMLNRSWLLTLQTHGMAQLYSQIYAEVVSGEMNEEGGTPGFLGFRESFLAMSTPEELVNGLTLVQTGDPSSGLLSRVTAPTVIYLGDDDILLSPQRGHDVAALFQNGRCEIVPNAGHVPFLDDPEGFQTVIHKLVEEVEARV